MKKTVYMYVTIEVHRN